MFDNMPGYIWMDGKIMPWAEAKIHVMTHALHYASAVYEGLRSYSGKVLMVREHYERFHQSADMLQFKIPFSIDELIAATHKLVVNGGYINGYIRSIAWCGTNKMTVANRDIDVHTAIAVWERDAPTVNNPKGLRLNIAKWRRPDPRTAPVHAKASGLYMISSMSKVESDKAGFDDSLMLSYKDNITEATSSNIFLVMEGKLYTPVPDCFLDGLTRRAVMKLAKGMGIEVIETYLTLEDLSRATEVFLTGTAIEILPVSSIEGEQGKWQFQNGIVTTKIQEAFKQLTRNIP